MFLVICGRMQFYVCGVKTFQLWISIIISMTSFLKLIQETGEYRVCLVSRTHSKKWEMKTCERHSLCTVHFSFWCAFNTNPENQIIITYCTLDIGYCKSFWIDEYTPNRFTQQSFICMCILIMFYHYNWVSGRIRNTHISRRSGQSGLNACFWIAM